MPIDASGRPIRPYTNSSESMNSVMAQTKLDYMRTNKKGNDQNLSKLEFTRNLFEEIHNKQQEELKLALWGLSELYQLAPFVDYLTVPVDCWFEWSEKERNDYVIKFKSLSIDDVLQRKEIKLNSALEIPASQEYKDLSIDVSSISRNKMLYKDELVAVVVDRALTLLNLPGAIQQQATLNLFEAKKYEVASRHAKHGKVECTLSKSHVVVPVLNMIKTALAEGALDKGVAGKKGSVNKYSYRPPRSQGHASISSASNDNPQASASSHVYNKIYHNDNPFILHILPAEAKKCKQCNKDFCHRVRVIPHDLVFEHCERYYFPLNGDWKNKQASNKEAIRYYHADFACMKARFPYFTNDYIIIPKEVKEKLHPSHIAHLVSQFSLQV
ncbi:Cyclin-dependent kinase 2 [Paramuricea clavata]|uniref:Cyclin-dependent kinase 2 n=1 Tax=Paramuricea clavata TaxID=317549 RepID=A0A6S7GFH0_PARCT|nr:Cyclin-dependent kinase 2 [Paramuricea clavata]